MIVVKCEQGSPEWHLNRSGAATASMFSVARDTYKSGKNKGELKAAALDYAFRLAVERISGEPLQDSQFETYAMRRGHEMEPEARDLHSFRINRDIEQTGIVLTDDRKFGASADGLIGEDGGSEYKCLVSPEKLRSILLDGDMSDYKDQVQGGLWMTGRKWWHFCLYCPALAPIGKELTIYEVERDDDYIEELEADLIAFDKVVESYRAQLTEQRKAA